MIALRDRPREPQACWNIPAAPSPPQSAEAGEGFLCPCQSALLFCASGIPQHGHSRLQTSYFDMKTVRPVGWLSHQENSFRRDVFSGRITQQLLTEPGLVSALLREAYLFISLFCCLSASKTIYNKLQ